MCVGSNQWDLTELRGDLESTPFWRAIASAGCQGVVQLVDGNCTPHTRVWWCLNRRCRAAERGGSILEIYVAFELKARGEPKDFELPLLHIGFRFLQFQLVVRHSGSSHLALADQNELY